MSIDDVRATIEQHTCVVAGVPYQFRLEWCATEKYVEPVSARTLLNIECIASAESGGTLRAAARRGVAHGASRSSSHPR